LPGLSVVDDAFQVIGVDKAAAYVKGLLNMIEHPVYDYDRMVVLVATSEGLSREEIGRHSWAEITPIWNMPRGGFKQLYEKLTGQGISHRLRRPGDSRVETQGC